jgi:hypothetical protein
MKEIKRDRSVYVEQLTEICEFLVREFYMEGKPAYEIKCRNVFKRIMRSSIFCSM